MERLVIGRGQYIILVYPYLYVAEFSPVPRTLFHPVRTNLSTLIFRVNPCRSVVETLRFFAIDSLINRSAFHLWRGPTMNTDTKCGTTSVIIPCWNQVEYTRQCVAALLRHTRNKWELIVIDNGSRDGTAEYLANIRDAAPMPVTVITNTSNQGFPAAINQGLQCARGEYLVLLNNDVVVTDGWLEQLTALTKFEAKVKSRVSNPKSKW